MRLKYEEYGVKEMLIDLQQQEETGDVSIFDCEAIAAKLRAAESLAGSIRFIDEKMGPVSGTILGALTMYERAGTKVDK